MQAFILSLLPCLRKGYKLHHVLLRGMILYKMRVPDGYFLDLGGAIYHFGTGLTWTPRDVLGLLIGSDPNGGVWTHVLRSPSFDGVLDGLGCGGLIPAEPARAAPVRSPELEQQCIDGLRALSAFERSMDAALECLKRNPGEKGDDA